MLQRHEVFIDGRWQPSDGTELVPVVNPATKQVFGTTTSAPFGGIKRSGVGREHGPEGYDSFLEYVPYTISPELARALPGAGQPPSVSGGAA